YTATTQLYTLSLHDALPICLLAPQDEWSVVHRHVYGIQQKAPCRHRDAGGHGAVHVSRDRSRALQARARSRTRGRGAAATECRRSEEHTSELQSLAYLVCRL